jgi:integrase
MPGQIIPRGKSTWLVRVYVGRDENRKRKYLNKTIHGNKKVADRWLTKALRDKDLGVEIEPAQDTLNEFLDKWLDGAAKAKVRPKTFAGYQDMLKRYIRPNLGSRPIAKLGTLEIQTVYNKLSESGLSPRTIAYTHMILKQALKQAIQWRLLIHNPCEGVKPPRQIRKEMQVLNPGQARKFLTGCKDEKNGPVFELAMTTGLRPSEYLALKWSDVDLAKGTVSINRSIDILPGGGWAFDENKTGRSRRTVKLHSSVAQTLREHHARQGQEQLQVGEKWTDHNLVFTNEIGGPVDRHNLANRDFRRILADAGLPQIRLYDLRHTAATLALVAGVPVKVLSEQLGHASAVLTLDTYSHVLPHMQDDAAARVEALLAMDATRSDLKSSKRHTMGTQRSL